MTPGMVTLSIFGYDPSKYHTGRAPIEVAALGVKLSPDQTAFRCNFVKVVDGVMIDYAGGNPSSEESLVGSEPGRSIVASAAVTLYTE